MKDLILSNTIGLPGYKNFVNAIGAENTILADKFFKAMWKAYIHNKGNVSLPYWSAKFEDKKVFNKILKALSDGGWIVSHSIPSRNWAEANINEDKLLQYCTIDELNQLRAQYKFDDYVLKVKDSTKSTATRIAGTTRDTGIVRIGAMKAGNTLFKFDTDIMEEYKFTIQKELTKSMDKIAKIISDSGGSMRIDAATYDSISIEVLDYYLQGGEYTRGNCLNDTRGRAISDALSKIGNPIGCKPLRALLVIQ